MNAVKLPCRFARPAKQDSSELMQEQLRAFIVRQSRLTSAERAELFALHQGHFDNVSPARFESDLAEKEWVIQLRHGDQLAGFSTQCVITLPFEGRVRRFLFSGDTIVDRTYWREHLLAGSFGHLMLRLIREHGEGDLYWFLISKGYRTYRFLPVFFQQFIPRPEGLSPPELERLLQHVAEMRYGAAFDPRSGLISPGDNGDRLREELCRVPEGRRIDPYVEFFLKRNPRYSLGHELACLAGIRRDNLNRCAWRVIERTQPVWLE